MAHADIAARLLHGGAGSLPRGFAGFFLLVKLLQQRVLAALGELCFLLGHSILCGSQSGAGIPQRSQLVQCRAPQQGLVLVIGGFQVLFCLGGSTGAFPRASSSAASAPARARRASRPIYRWGVRSRSSRKGWWRRRSRVALSGCCSSVSGVSQQTMRPEWSGHTVQPAGFRCSPARQGCPGRTCRRGGWPCGCPGCPAG